MGFLGMPRSDGAAGAVETSRETRLPMALLAALCVALGILPTYVIPVLDTTVTPLSKESATAALVPPFFNVEAQREEGIAPGFLAEFHDLGAQVGQEVLPGRGLVVLHRGEERNPVVFAMSTSYMMVALALILLLVFVVFRALTRERSFSRGPVWDGGLRRLWPEITYTATGFSNPVRVVFDAILRPPSRTARRPLLSIFGRRSDVRPPKSTSSIAGSFSRRYTASVGWPSSPGGCMSAMSMLMQPTCF